MKSGPVNDGSADPKQKPKIGDTRPDPHEKPQIGDSRPAPEAENSEENGAGDRKRKRRKGNRSRGRSNGQNSPVEALTDDDPLELDEDTLRRRKGRERRGKPIGRYLMCGSVSQGSTQVGVLEGRSLIEHYLSRPADDISEIHGNIYLGTVQNVLPGMEAAFVDIGTPKNAVLYRGDVQFAAEDTGKRSKARIEQVLK